MNIDMKVTLPLWMITFFINNLLSIFPNCLKQQADKVIFTIFNMYQLLTLFL